MVVAVIHHVTYGSDTYDAIVVWCPGCEYEDEGRKVGGLHMLPISGDASKHPVWGWNKDLKKVTLSPSILTHHSRGEGAEFRCHSFLVDGQWKFLSECSHKLANQTVPMVQLPDWVVK